MTISWKYIIVVINALLRDAEASIVGVTYMDDFDFEQRYSNVHECDPFYWHPLHLPEYCADMYERLIRSRIARKSPVRIVKENQPYYDTYAYESEPHDYEYEDSIEYKKMIRLVKEDAENQPIFPTFEIIPFFGPVAMYRQPVSTKTVNMIKKLSGAYAQSAMEVPFPQLPPTFNFPPSPMSSQPPLSDQESNEDKEKTQSNKGTRNLKSSKKLNKILKQAMRRGWKKKEDGELVTLRKRARNE